ncbi:MAG: OmpA family protein [Bacteroidales bacterium]|jgi:outer membrane protein OmpA-like peptidoglycan-associated protein
MKRLLITLMILGLTCSTTQAQSILRRLERTARTAAERAAERKVEEKVEEEVSKALDEALEESEKEKQEAGSDKNKEGRSSSRRAVQNQDLEFDDWDMEAEDLEMMKRIGRSGSYNRVSDQGSRSGRDPDSDSARNANSQGNRNAVSDSGQEDPQNRRAQMEWAKSDFVAGDEIFFEDNLAGEQLGEFPSHWDIIEGNAEVVRIDGENAIMLLDDARLVPFMEDQQRFLPDVFTLEFDFFLHPWDDEYYETGEYPFSDYMLYFFNDRNGDWDIPDMEVLEFTMDPKAKTIFCYYHSGSYDRRDASVDEVDFNYGGWSHFALSFNKRALKIYIDGVRIINLPNMAAPQRMILGQGWAVPNTTYIRNIRLAKGAVPLYDRMMQDGKFISYGITFDTGKSVIKPESAGELNRIVQLLKENPSLRFSVEGHTDATGSASSNQKLSEDRARAVVDRLVEMGIDPGRLTGKGLGQNNPVADNSSAEGRAKNRRVEFVKL